MNVHVSPATIAVRQPVEADLAQLGPQLRAAFETQIEAVHAAPPDIDLDEVPAYMAARNRCEDLVTEIEAVQPKTFFDFAVKMLAFAWTHYDAFLALPSQPSPNTGTRILHAFVPAILEATGLMPFAERTLVATDGHAVAFVRDLASCRV